VTGSLWDIFRWAIAVEVLGLAFLPLTLWLLSRLPDRGYAFAKLVGLIIVTYVTWLVGLVLPIAGSAAVPFMALAIVGGAGWVLRHSQAIEELRAIARLVVIEESLFLVGLFGYSLLRVTVFGAAIAHTEQYMDMAFLNASYHSASYPPYDPWMSGHSINYYYFGYLTFATLAKLGAVAPSVAYNLSLASLFGWTVSMAYGLGQALTRRMGWAFLAPVFVAILGNWHAILWQIPHAGCAGASSPGFWGWLWESTRVVGGHFTLLNWACGHSTPPENTINEYPLFSFVLGDLHPHVMALPAALLAIALGCNAVFGQADLALERTASAATRLLTNALCIGVLFTINSWDYPTYLLVISGCVVVNAYVRDPTSTWWRAPARTVVALTFLSLLLFAPFYLHFTSLAHGIGLVHTPSDIFEYLQVLGFPLLTCTLLVGALGLLLRPVEEEEAPEEMSDRAAKPLGLADQSGAHLPAFGLIAGLVAAAVVGVVTHLWVLVIVVTLGLAALTVLERVLNTEEPNRCDACALVLLAVACLVLALTEVIYLRDSFDLSDLYRMNTVFKFYYQAWVLLGIGGAYGVYRGWRIVTELYGRTHGRLALGLVLLCILGAGVYTANIGAYTVDAHDLNTLDGMAWLKQDHPGDYNAIRWIESHGTGRVILEAVGGDFQPDFARVSTFSGLPTVMGWAGHEDQWRPGNPDIAKRVSDVRTIYTTPSVGVAERLLRQYGVRYVFVGDGERSSYGGASPGFEKFRRFMTPIYRSGNTVIYTW